jgi:hypothetical protein
VIVTIAVVILGREIVGGGPRPETGLRDDAVPALVLLINPALLNNASFLLSCFLLASSMIIYATKRIRPGIEKL